MVKKIDLAWMVTVVGVALPLCGCEVATDLDRPYHLATTSTGGAGGASTSSTGGAGGSTGGTGGAPGCVHATFPAPPDVADDGGDIEFVTAMRKIDLDDKDFDVTLGLDLDGVCTCDMGGPPTCVQPAGDQCDGPGGVDNSVGLIFATVKSISSNVINSGQLSGAADAGQWTNLLRVRGYNGKPDDAKVTAMIYLTQGVNAGMPKPVWDGNDAWPVDDASLADGVTLDSALIQSTEGYVTNGVLVLKIANEPLRIRGPLFAMNLDLVDVVVSATLTNEATGYKLSNGITAAKWTVAKAFPDLASIRYAGGSKLCTDDNNYVGVKAALCGDADLRMDGTNGPCDALSFGATFTAEAAKLGPVVAGEAALADPCSPETDPSTDMCN